MGGRGLRVTVTIFKNVFYQHYVGHSAFEKGSHFEIYIHFQYYFGREGGGHKNHTLWYALDNVDHSG